MKASQLLLVVGAAAGAYWLVSQWKAASPAPQARREPGNAPVVHLVEETLHRHAGEDSPMVHAFEAALEQETRYDEELAHASGLVRA